MFRVYASTLNFPLVKIPTDTRSGRNTHKAYSPGPEKKFGPMNFDPVAVTR